MQEQEIIKIEKIAKELEERGFIDYRGANLKLVIPEREELDEIVDKCLEGKKYLVFYATLSDERDADGNKIIDTGLLTHDFPGESFFIVSREFKQHVLRACEKMFNK